MLFQRLKNWAVDKLGWTSLMNDEMVQHYKNIITGNIVQAESNELYHGEVIEGPWNGLSNGTFVTSLGTTYNFQLPAPPNEKQQRALLHSARELFNTNHRSLVSYTDQGTTHSGRVLEYEDLDTHVEIVGDETATYVKLTIPNRHLRQMSQTITPTALFRFSEAIDRVFGTVNEIDTASKTGLLGNMLEQDPAQDPTRHINPEKGRERGTA